MSNPNRCRAVHQALAALIAGLLDDGDDLVRNPDGYVAPKARTVGELVPYTALEDDRDPEVLATLCGPVYDLKATPRVVLAFAGGIKDGRQDAADIKLEALRAALAADPRLGGVCDYADIDSAEPCEADGALGWMAGGLEVRVAILFSAPTRAG